MYRIFSKEASLLYNLRQLKYLPSGIVGYFRRAFRGWNYSDVWDIDSWFMEVMPQMLQHLRDKGIGYQGDADHPTFESWHNTLDHMIFLLKEMNEDTCSQQNEIWNRYWDEIRNTPIDSFKANVDRKLLMDREKEINDYRDKCKNEFFELFSKYFWNLWD